MESSQESGQESSQKSGLDSRRILEGGRGEIFVYIIVPAILGLSMIGLNSFVDGVFVSHLVGESAFVGLSLAYPITNLTFSLGTLVGVGAGTYLSHAVGSGDVEAQRRVFPTMTGLSLIIGLGGTLLVWFGADEMLRALGAAGEPLDAGTRYLRTLALGGIPAVLGIGGNMLIRGEGKMVTSMVMVTLAMATNIVLTPIAIEVLGWGISGAAMATNVSMAVYCVTTWVHYHRLGDATEVRIRGVSLAPGVARPILSLGMPHFVAMVVGLAQQILALRILSTIGTDRDLALFGSITRLVMLCAHPVFGLMRAMTSILAINHGAGNHGRLEELHRFYTRSAVAVMFLAVLPMVLFPARTLGVILPQVTFMSTEMLDFRLVVSTLILYPVMYNGLAFLGAVKAVVPATFLALGRQVVLLVPILLLASWLLGPSGIYRGLALVEVLTAAFTAYLVVLYRPGRESP